jgi:hypothetical protein
MSCTKISRNDQCTCGSGKKYKKCCIPKTAKVKDKLVEIKAIELGLDSFDEAEDFLGIERFVNRVFENGKLIGLKMTAYKQPIIAKLNDFIVKFGENDFVPMDSDDFKLLTSQRWL